MCHLPFSNRYLKAFLFGISAQLPMNNSIQPLYTYIHTNAHLYINDTFLKPGRIGSTNLEVIIEL